MPLKWGLGIEKEFPINFGPFKTTDVIKTYKNVLQHIHTGFSDFLSELIRNEHENLFRSFLDEVFDKLTAVAFHNPDDQKDFFLNFKGSNVVIYNASSVDLLKDEIEIPGDEDIDVHYERVNNQNVSQMLRMYSQGLIDEYVNNRKDIMVVFELYQAFSGVICACLLDTSHTKGYFARYLHLNLCNDIYISAVWHFNSILKFKTGNLLTTLDSTFRTHKDRVIIKESIDLLESLTIEGTSITKYKRNYLNVDTDPGGFEIRTSNYRNTTAFECTSELMKHSSEFRKSIRDVFYLKEKHIHFEDTFASYYKPMLSIRSIDINSTSPKVIEINLSQTYTGENELNVTLPYIEWEDLIILKNCIRPGASLLKTEHKTKNEFMQYFKHDIRSTKTDIRVHLRDIFKESIPASFDEYIKHFEKSHLRIMKSLRILSPLFFAVLTGVNYLSIGDNSTIPETSKRFSQYSGYRLLSSQKLSDIYKPFVNRSDYNTMAHHLFDDIQTPNGAPIEFSVNRKMLKYHPVKDPSKRKLFGFEWKVLDQYPSQYTPNILLFIVLMSQYLHNLDIDPPDIDQFMDEYPNARNFEQFIHDILFQGWDTDVSFLYVQTICDTFRLTELKRSLTSMSYDDRFTCADFLQSLYDWMYSYFMNTEQSIYMIECFFPDFKTGYYKDTANFPNINMENYCNMLKDLKKYHPMQFKELTHVISGDTDNEDFYDLEICSQRFRKDMLYNWGYI